MFNLFDSVLTDTTASGATLSLASFGICTACSLALGAAIAWLYAFRSLALLPAMVQLVIMLVNGNLGTGVAVMGAFSLVRFRSVPGSAREISSIFLAMAVGLATGTGYVAVAALSVAVIGLAGLLYTVSSFGESRTQEKELKITIPESLDYTGVFDDIFQRYTHRWELVQVRTASMGSLYRLDYRITLKNAEAEKAFLDELRCRNGNLEISCGRVPSAREEL